jgi:diamine N-acetyltransferase
MAKRFIRPFETGQIGLRLLTKEDLPTTLAWRNQDRVRKHFVTSRILTADEHQAWYEAYVGKDDDFVFLFSEVRDLGRPVGQVSLYRIDWTRKMAEFGRLIIGDEPSLHKGYARAATLAMLSLAFDHFRLDTVVLTVYESNAHAIKLYQSVGFTAASAKEGLVSMTLQKRARAGTDRGSSWALSP